MRSKFYSVPLLLALLGLLAGVPAEAQITFRVKRGLLSRSRLVDLLRRAGTRLSGPWRLSEPGDGYMREVSEASDPREAVFFHDFFDPQEVGVELGAAGLLAEEVNRGWWVCGRHLPN